MSDLKRERTPASRAAAALTAVALALLAACSSSPQNKQGNQDDGKQVASGKSAGSSDKPSNSPTPKPPAPPARLSVTPAVHAASVNPRQPVRISVSGGKLSSVQVLNPQGRPVTGRQSADRTSWISNEVLGFGKTYQVRAAAANADGKVSRTASTFTTVTPANYTAASISPSQAVDDVGTGMILKVIFDEPITDKAAAERALHVRTAPYTVGAWRWMDDQNVEWRPQNFWRPGTRVTIAADIYGVEVGPGLYGQQDVSSSFRIHDDWHVRASVAAHQLVVYHNGAIVRRINASFGKPARPTHNGPHVISEKYHLYMMNSDTYGLPANDPEGYKNFPAYWAQRISNGGEFVHVNEDTIYAQGRENVSHGCINVSMVEGKWLYDHLDVGDVVNVIGGSPQLPVWDGLGGWNTSFTDWKAGSALAGQSR